MTTPGKRRAPLALLSVLLLLCPLTSSHNATRPDTCNTHIDMYAKIHYDLRFWRVRRKAVLSPHLMFPSLLLPHPRLSHMSSPLLFITLASQESGITKSMADSNAKLVGSIQIPGITVQFVDGVPYLVSPSSVDFLLNSHW
jgi:hypothetical protein